MNALSAEQYGVSSVWWMVVHESHFLLLSDVSRGSEMKEKVLQLYDYYFIFGMGHSILFRITFIVLHCQASDDDSDFDIHREIYRETTTILKKRAN